jgi:hypothetical protein
MQATVAERDKIIAAKDRELAELRAEKDKEQESDEEEEDEETDKHRSKRAKRDEGAARIRSLLKCFTICHALWIDNPAGVTGPLNKTYNKSKFFSSAKDRAQCLARELRALMPKDAQEEIGTDWFRAEVRVS